MPRDNFYNALVKNLKDTAQTAYYGAVGIAYTDGIQGITPRINARFAAILTMLPLAIRYFTYNKMAENEHDQASLWSKAKLPLAEALTNMVMPVITILSASHNPVFGIYMLGGWLGSKILVGGDASPLDHVISYIAGTNIADAPAGRENFFSSLTNNLSATLTAGWYGVIGLASTVGAPFIGTMTKTTGALLAFVPLLSRISQTNKLAQKYEFNADRENMDTIATVAINGAMAALVMGTSMYNKEGDDSAAAFGLLTGWLLSRVISAGERSPLDHISAAISGNNRNVGEIEGVGHAARFEERRAPGHVPNQLAALR